MLQDYTYWLSSYGSCPGLTPPSPKQLSKYRNPSMLNDFLSCWVTFFETFNLIPQSLQASGTPQEGTSKKNHQRYFLLLSLRLCLNFYISIIDDLEWNNGFECLSNGIFHDCVHENTYLRDIQRLQSCYFGLSQRRNLLCVQGSVHTHGPRWSTNKLFPVKLSHT